MAAGESGRRVALTTAAAGLVGTLAGTVIGGLISFAAVWANIQAQEASDLRASRQEKYSDYVTDLNVLGLKLDNFSADGTIDSAEDSELTESAGDLSGSYAAAILVSSPRVFDALVNVYDALRDFDQALQQGAIVKSRMQEAN
jgi:hypothetical protein